MKSVIYTIAAVLLAVSGFAQADTTKPNQPDTIKVGNFIIVKKDKKAENHDTTNSQVLVDIGTHDDYDDHHHYYHERMITTNWLIFDLGFANWRDQTAYGSPEANAYLHAGQGDPFTSADLNLKNNKTSNVNIWLFMQK